LILNYIIEKTYELNIKMKEFWHYIKINKKNWDFHYQNERALKKAFSILSNVINSIAKTRNIYDEASKKINALWDSTKETFTRDQLIQVLRSLWWCVLRDMIMKNARRAMILAMKNRLKNLVWNVSTSRKSINKDWIKVTNENYDSRRIKSATNFDFKLRMLSSSLSSSFRINLKRRKKIEKQFSLISSSIDFKFRFRWHRHSQFLNL
jgi:uncharacterized protein (UPF0147 family)